MTERETHIVLVQPEIPWNTGNIGRTCVALGAQLHLVRPLGFQIDESAVRRAGLDYWKHVKPQVWESWEDFEKILPSLGTAFFFSVEGKKSLWQIDFPARSVLLFGCETRGLPQEIRDKYEDRIVSVPMVEGPIRSLNLSTTAGIVCAAATRHLIGGGEY